MRSYILDFGNILRFKTIVLVTSLTTALVLSVSYFHPSNQAWMEDGAFSWFNLLQFALIDQFLIELLTVSIIASGLKRYSKLTSLQRVEESIKGLVLFILKLIPFCLLIYFLFAPFTTSLRYLYHKFILNRRVDYIEEYFFLDFGIYLSYLISVSLIIATMILIAIFKSKHQKKEGVEYFEIIDLQVKSNSGMTVVHSNNITHIKKKAAKYIVVLNSKEEFQINQNISELDSLLGEDFIRINRSTIINLNYLKDYSFWKNEKYIVRLSDFSEHKSTRPRIKEIKKRQSKIKLRTYQV